VVTLWFVVLALWMSVVIYEAFSLPPIEGLAAHPVVYFHPPVAMVTFVIFLVTTFFGVRYLRLKSPDDDIKSWKAAELGLLFATLATVTGAFWSRVNWGSYWSWDPKQTGIFVVLLIYTAYGALRSSIPDPDRRGRLCAVYAMIGFISALFFMFVLPRVLPSLHPNDALIGRGSARPVRLLFLGSAAGFLGIFFTMFSLSVRLEQIKTQIKELKS